MVMQLLSKKKPSGHFLTQFYHPLLIKEVINGVCAGLRISIDGSAWLVCRVIEVTGRLVLANVCCLRYRLSDTSSAVSRVVFDPQNRFKVVEMGDFIFSHQIVSGLSVAFL